MNFKTKFNIGDKIHFQNSFMRGTGTIKMISILYDGSESFSDISYLVKVERSYTNNINELVAKVLEVEVLTLISSETKEEEGN